MNILSLSYQVKKSEFIIIHSQPSPVHENNEYLSYKMHFESNLHSK